MSSLDLAAGLDFLRELAAESQFSWLSANLVDRETGQPIFSPYLSRTLGEARVAVLGLTGGAALAAGLLGDKAVLRPWDEVLPSLLTELRPQHDFIILLTDLPLATCQEIVRRQSEIALIINASGENLSQSRLISGHTIMAATDKQGRNLGLLEIFLNPGRDWSQAENYYVRLQEKQADLARTRGQIDQFRGRSEMVSRVGNLERRADVLQVELSDLRRNLGENPASYFSNTFYAMTPEVADDPEVLAVVGATKAAVTALAGETALRSAAAENFRPQGYIGRKACNGCHRPATSKWRQTGHAAAYATLVRKNRQFDFDCLPCHVTGINAVNTDQVLILAPELRDVTCEACHGPGRAHAESNGFANLRKVGEFTCKHCHVPEHDDDFDYARDVRLATCQR